MDLFLFAWSQSNAFLQEILIEATTTYDSHALILHKQNSSDSIVSFVSLLKWETDNVI